MLSAILIFLAALILIVFEVFDKSLIALGGALLMVLTKIITPEEAVHAIDFETVLLLMAMMILVEIAKKSGIFDWLNVKLIALTKGNPLFIFLIFALITALFSAFLDNVTTIILIAPITIALVRGMGKDPKIYILAEIFLSNIGGALTLIGDPPNIIIGSKAKLTFLDFIVNLYPPIVAGIIVVLLPIILINWSKLKPISRSLKELFVTNILIKKITYKFQNVTLSRGFIIKSVATILLTILGFMLHSTLHLPAHIVALCGATILALITSKHVKIHEALLHVEWTTLIFFAGLFIMVAGLEHTGVLEHVAMLILNSTDNLMYLALIILWGAGIASMVVDNIPFVTIMIPVIFQIQESFAGDPHLTLLWWALSLGACIGGNGTLIGASANVVAADIAKKNHLHISFLGYLKYSLPLTLGVLMVSSVYIIFRFNV